MRCLLACMCTCVALALCFKPCVRRLDFKERLLIHLAMRRFSIDAKIASEKESKNKRPTNECSICNLQIVLSHNIPFTR